MRVVIVSVLVVGQLGGLVEKVLLQKIPVFFLWRVLEFLVVKIEWKCVHSDDNFLFQLIIFN